MTAPPIEVTRAGVYPNMPAEQYHADPVPGGSLSSGGARRLLPPSCPAKFKHWLDNPDPASRVCEFGNAAHLQVLGRGTPVAVIDAVDYRTKAAKTQLADARAAGLTPVKVEEWERIQAMAAKLREHPVAGPLFEPGSGQPEVSAFWQDQEFGIWRRKRVDWLPSWFYPDGRLVIPDYKTCANADPDRLERVLVDRGYDQPAAWYVDGAGAVGLAPKGATFVFVFQEKDPPYVISVMQADAVVLDRGRARNRWAMSRYVEGKRTGEWPGYVEGIGTLQLPRYVENVFHDEVEAGIYDQLPGGRQTGDGWRKVR